jgi:hypothetical protein
MGRVPAVTPLTVPIVVISVVFVATGQLVMLVGRLVSKAWRAGHHLPA